MSYWWCIHLSIRNKCANMLWHKNILVEEPRGDNQSECRRGSGVKGIVGEHHYDRSRRWVTVVDFGLGIWQ